MSFDTQPGMYTTTLAQHNTNQIPLTRSLYVAVAGAVKVGYHNGTTDTFTNLAVGYHPIKIVMLYDTGTDAAVEVHGIY
jgi:hypothetical protein